MRFLVTIFLLIFLTSCHKELPDIGTDIRLAPLFTEDMVLQRDQKVRVFGLAPKNTFITVKIQGKKAQTQTNHQGIWLVEIGPLRAGGPYQLRVEAAGQRRTIKNVFVGEVWLASGQSNMQFKVDKSSTSKEDIKKANNYRKHIRYIKVASLPAAKPQALCSDCQWHSLDAESIKDFSAVAFAFAVNLYEKYKVPVGIVQAAWDSTAIEHWMSRESLKDFPEFANQLDSPPAQVYWLNRDFRVQDMNFNRDIKLFIKLSNQEIPLTAWLNTKQLDKKEALVYQVPINGLTMQNTIRIRLRPGESSEAAIKSFIAGMDTSYCLLEGQKIPVTNWINKTLIDSQCPNVLFNALINPIIPYTIKGILWYQGESNVYNPSLYKRLFPSLVKDWRNKWKQDSLPFLVVQLAAYKDEDPTKLSEFRLVQSALVKEIKDYYLATAVDLGQRDGDIHPLNKRPVGQRLFLLADRYVYANKKAHSDYPQIREVKLKAQNLEIYFSHLGKSLQNKCSRETEIAFELAGQDKVFEAVPVKIYKDHVSLNLAKISEPKYIRYAWGAMPKVCLYNSFNLPLLPLSEHVNI